MITKRDIQIGKIALREGMISKEQLTRCLQIQKKITKKVGLGAILLKKGYVTKEQLEKIVEIHNADKNGSEDAATGETTKTKKKKKKKKKKSAEASEATASEAPKSEAASQAPSEAPSDAKPAESTSATAEPEKAEEKKKSARVAAEEEKPAKAEKKSARVASDEASDVATKSEVPSDDGSLFESAPSDVAEGGTGARRVVACGDCGKKYRLKKHQAGKKFKCRKCGSKVKVPKNLFDKPAKKEKETAGIAVEEFSLGSSDSAAAPPAEEAKTEAGKNGAAARGKTGRAGAVTAAIEKVEKAEKAEKKVDPASIADLAKAALEHKPKTLAAPPSKGSVLLGWIQAVVLVLVAGGTVAGVVVWRKWEAEQAEKEQNDLRDKEWSNWQGPFDKSVADCKAAIADPALTSQNAERLLTCVTAMETALTQTLSRGDNDQRRHDLEAKLDLKSLKRDAFLRRGAILESLGGIEGAQEATRAYARASEIDARHVESFLKLGRAQLRRHAWAEAIAALEKASKIDPEALTPRAMLALAKESGDLCRDAAREYETLAKKTPLARVLEARAYLLEGDVERAAQKADEASRDAGIAAEPESLAAAHVIHALALEAKRSPADAEKAYDAAVAAAPESPRPLIARGRFRLRAAKPQDAVTDFEAAALKNSGSRARLALGDARAALLDISGAKTAWTEAITVGPAQNGALLGGEVDPFEMPRSGDPRAVAKRRLAEVALAAGERDARSLFQASLELDPYDPEGHVALARLDLAMKQLGPADEKLSQAEKLCVGLAPGAGGKPAWLKGPATARTLLARGLYWIAKGEPSRAVEATEAATQADALAIGAEAATLRGRAFRLKTNEAAAREQFTIALALEVAPERIEGQLTSLAASSIGAAVAGDENERARVETASNLVLTWNPVNATALVLAARLALAKQKPEKALALINRAVDFENGANPYYVEGLVAHGLMLGRDLPDELKNVGRALLDFDAAVKISGERSARAFVGRGIIREIQNDLRKAREDATAAIQLDQNLAEAYELRCRVNKALGEESQAAADAAKAAELRKKK